MNWISADVVAPPITFGDDGHQLCAQSDLLRLLSDISQWSSRSAFDARCAAAVDGTIYLKAEIIAYLESDRSTVNYWMSPCLPILLLRQLK